MLATMTDAGLLYEDALCAVPSRIALDLPGLSDMPLVQNHVEEQ